MSEHGEVIWNRGEAWKIFRDSRTRFSAAIREGAGASAYVSHASDCYSLVKRFTKGVKKVIALLLFRRAVKLAKKAYGLGLQTGEQADVVSTILSKAPWYIGGDIGLAYHIVEEALKPNSLEGSMVPHTRALLLLTRGGIEFKMNFTRRAFHTVLDALELVPLIFEEADRAMGQRQAVRVLSGGGFLLWDHRGEHPTNVLGMSSQSLNHIAKALRLARRVSKDQEAKIISECNTRSILDKVEKRMA